MSLWKKEMCSDGLRECPKCHGILKSVCSKSGCKENGQKPLMILPAASKSLRLRVPLFPTDDGSESDDDNQSTDTEIEVHLEEDISETEIGSERKSEYDVGEKEYDAMDEEQIVGQTFVQGDYVKITNGNFAGMYASVLGEGYGDEVEIQYFMKKGRYWILKENDYDSRERDDLAKVEPEIYCQGKRNQFVFYE